jgi:hypothetical protein
VPYDDRVKTIQGADYTYTDSIKCSAADPLVKAWLTLKTDLSVADPGSLQKAVTTANVAGTGQITADGASTGGAASVRFDLTAANTTALTAQSFLFDVKAKTASGAFAYGAQGIWANTQNVTTTTT